MQCPNCGNTDLLPKFRCCPECGSLLPRVDVPNSATNSTEAIAQTTTQQGNAGSNSGLGVDISKQIQDRKQEDSTTVKKKNEISTEQSATLTVKPECCSPAAGDYHESNNQPAEKGADPMEIQAIPELKPVVSIEAGVENARSVQTEPYSGDREPAMGKFVNIEGSNVGSTASSATHVSSVQTVTSAAELDQQQKRQLPPQPQHNHQQLPQQYNQQWQLPLQPQQLLSPQQRHHHQQPTTPQQHAHQQSLSLQQQQHLYTQQVPAPQHQRLPQQMQPQQHGQDQPLSSLQQRLPQHPDQQVLNQQQQLPPLKEQQQLPPRHLQQLNEVNGEGTRTEGGQEPHVPPIVQTSGGNKTYGSSQAFQNTQKGDHVSSLTTQRQEEAKYIQKKESSEAGPPGTRHVVEDRDVTLKCEKVETTTLVLAEPGRNEPALEHPLSEQMSEGDRKGAEPTKKSTGHWPQSKTKPQQDSTSGREKNKTQKSYKEDKNKAIQSHLGIAQVPLSLKQVEPENGVTVVFHVFLETSFKMEEEHLHIRAQGEDLGNFEVNCVDLSLIRNCKDEKNFMRFSGQFTLSMDRAKRGTAYKYVILQKGKVHWEYLAEFSPKHGGIVNRFLLIPHKYLKVGAKWDKFDGVAYIYDDMSWWKRLLLSTHTVENRKSALLMQMPKWKGFLVDEPGEDMTATIALLELSRVVRCITEVWVREDGAKPEMRKPADFNIKTVLVELLQPKVSENATAQGKTDLNARASALVSSLAIVLLLNSYNVRLGKEHMLLLLKCLALEVVPTDKKCTTYEVVLKEFSEGLRACAARGIEDLCNEIMADSRRGDGEWLFAIPLLHFLREDSKPFEEPDITESYNELEWIGAQKLKIEEFRRSKKQDLWHAFPQLASAFEVDRLFKRTFLHIIPVWELHNIVSSKLFHISDICVALISFCSIEKVPNSKWKDVAKCITLMISQMEEEPETAESSVKELEFTTSMCLKLLETFLETLTFGDHLETICNFIKLLFTSIRRQGHQITRSRGDEERQAKQREVIDELWKFLKKRLMVELPPIMSKHYKCKKLLSELRIWSELLLVADENQGFNSYRTFLTEEMTYRARRVGEKYLVKIFCELQMDAYEKAVGETFSKLASEAVEKIINSSKTDVADHAFQTLRSSSAREAREDSTKAAKYGELLSVLLTKSWPKKGGRTDRHGLDPQTVEFLLSWNPVAGYLNFFGIYKCIYMYNEMFWSNG